MGHPGAGEADLVGIHDDHEIATSHVWSVSWAMLAHQDRGDLNRQAANDLILGIDDEPDRLHISGLGTIGFDSLKDFPTNAFLLRFGPFGDGCSRGGAHDNYLLLNGWLAERKSFIE